MMTIENIQELIKVDETRTVELKKTTGEIKDGMRSVCAMLNSSGGYVIFGIAPQTLKIIGQTVSDNTRQEIAREIRKLEPFVNMAVEYIEVPGTNGSQVVVLHADKKLFGEAPYVYDGRAYYKLESTTMQMPQQMYESMLRSRDEEKFRWDSMIAANMTVADLDEKRIKTAIAMGIKGGRLSPDAEVEPIPDILAKLKLLDGGRLTNAAVMLFAKNVDDYPELELKMGYFKGKDKIIFIDNKMESGNFFDLLDAGVSFCFRNLRLSGEVKGLLREERLEIPIEALREALTNALCHRQYERTDGSVSLAIYDDRVEIINPGKFPPQITTDSIKKRHESYPRNKKIAQVLYLTKNLEKWGTGANRMIELCHEQHLPEPEWQCDNGTVCVTFRRPTVLGKERSEVDYSIDTKLDSLTGQVKRLIISLGASQMTKKQVMQQVKLSSSSNVVDRYIKPAIEQGYVTMLYPENPRHPKQKYILTEKGLDILEALKRKG